MRSPSRFLYILASVVFTASGCGSPELRLDASEGAAALQSACPGALAQATFRQALCTCGDYTAAAGLAVSVMNSDSTAPADAPVRAPVGINGDVVAAGPIHTPGSLTLGGSHTGRIAGLLSVGRDLDVHGALHCRSNVQVQGAAHFNGATTLQGSLHVAQGVTLSPQGSLSVALGEQPSVVVHPIDTTPACDCTAKGRVNIAAWVAAHRRSNDNAHQHLDPDSLRNVSRATHLTLPGGNYYLRGIGNTEDITLVAEGQVALFIDGDITTSHQLRIVNAPAGTLDVYVAGNITVTGGIFFGNVRTPAQARLYVGGTALHAGGGLTLAGNLYAPQANLEFAHEARALGSLWVNNLRHSAPLQVVYDAAVRDAAQGCESYLSQPTRM